MSLALKHAPCPYLPDHEVVGCLTTGGAEVALLRTGHREVEVMVNPISTPHLAIKKG
jgi:D-arabinose 1-dehydrogenase-like Zn-dependent alcohol dehydrogenase